MSPAAPAELDALRQEIEAIDRDVVMLIARRMRAARAVGRVKRKHHLPITDPTREAAVVRRAVEQARAQELPEEDMREIFWHIIGLCRRAQLAGHSEAATP